MNSKNLSAKFGRIRYSSLCAGILQVCFWLQPPTPSDWDPLLPHHTMSGGVVTLKAKVCSSKANGLVGRSPDTLIQSCSTWSAQAERHTKLYPRLAYTLNTLPCGIHTAPSAACCCYMLGTPAEPAYGRSVTLIHAIACGLSSTCSGLCGEGGVVCFRVHVCVHCTAPACRQELELECFAGP